MLCWVYYLADPVYQDHLGDRVQEATRHAEKHTSEHWTDQESDETAQNYFAAHQLAM